MSGLLKFFAVDKIQTLMQIIKANGGFRKSLYTLYRTDDLKVGNLVGEDKFGNKYFENNAYFVGRNRWVIYNPKSGLEYDGSMVPAEWFGWLHYKTDFPPTVKKPVKHDWMTDHEWNVTGTKDAYVPYSTTRTKVESWVPGKKSASN